MFTQSAFALYLFDENQGKIFRIYLIMGRQPQMLVVRPSAIQYYIVEMLDESWSKRWPHVGDLILRILYFQKKYTQNGVYNIELKIVNRELYGGCCRLLELWVNIDHKSSILLWCWSNFHLYGWNNGDGQTNTHMQIHI